jgi:hypothetical protein
LAWKESPGSAFWILSYCQRRRTSIH